MRKKTIYNNVSVTEGNRGTNNHCINVNQLLNEKNFQFDIDGEKYIVTPRKIMDYISKNPGCYRKKKYVTLKDDNEKVSYSGYYLIPDDYIINNSIE